MIYNSETGYLEKVTGRRNTNKHPRRKPKGCDTHIIKANCANDIKGYVRLGSISFNHSMIGKRIKLKVEIVDDLEKTVFRSKEEST